MKRDANRDCYLSLDQRKYANKYVVIVDGKLIGAGKDVEKYVRKAWKMYPGKTPFVARMRDPRKLYIYLVR